MDKSTFNAQLSNLSSYTIQAKSDIQQEKNKYPYCALLQVMDLLSDKATDTPQWETRFLPRTSLYLFDYDVFAAALRNVKLTEVQTPVDIKTKSEVAHAKDLEFEAANSEPFDIMKEINAYQEVSFKTAPKSVILSNFLKVDPSEEENEASNGTSNHDINDKKSLTPDVSLGTETLAVILEQQGRYDKALAIYKNLLAQNPEKSSIFAPRIQRLTTILNSK